MPHSHYSPFNCPASKLLQAVHYQSKYRDVSRVPFRPGKHAHQPPPALTLGVWTKFGTRPRQTRSSKRRGKCRLARAATRPRATPNPRYRRSERPSSPDQIILIRQDVVINNPETRTPPQPHSPTPPHRSHQRGWRRLATRSLSQR